MNNIFKQKSQKGFTLIEMIIALAIFTVVAVIAIGALLRITDANRKSITLKTTINNLNFALESMSREMRVGSTYNCDTNNGAVTTGNLPKKSCTPSPVVTSPTSGGGWTIAFKSSKKSGSGVNECNLIYAYRYINSAQTIKKGEQTVCTDSINDADFNELISSDIKITDTVIDVISNDTSKPKVFIWLKGYSGVKEKEKTEFSIQTTVSQRIQ